MKKPDFEQLTYYPDLVCWPVGNKLAGLPLVAQFVIDRDGYEEEQRQKRAEAKEIYETYISKGAEFIPGDGKGRTSTCHRIVITFINQQKSLITWKQSSPMSEFEKSMGWKPAAGKWPLSGFIYCIQAGYIIPVQPDSTLNP